jgi:hypothetical protein
LEVGKTDDVSPTGASDQEAEKAHPLGTGLHRYLKEEETRDESELNFKYVNLREFICRYGFESAYAWAINLLTDTYPEEFKKPMKKLELVYIALLCPSVINFVGVLLKWVFERPPIDSWEETNIVHLYVEYCRMYGLKERGGKMARYTSQGGDINWPTLKLTEDQFKEEMKKMEDGLADLNQGNMPEEVFHPDCEGLGEMYGYSFAPICVFVGLTSSDAAINKAMGAKFNPDSNYGKNICSKLETEYGCEDLDPEKLPWNPIFHSLATIFGDGRVRDSENGICASNREKAMADVFPLFMDMYTIRNGKPQIKLFDHKTWADNFAVVRRAQRNQRQQRMAVKGSTISPEILSQKPVALREPED